MNATSKMIKIIVADDHPLARNSLKRRLLESDKCMLIGEAENGKDLVEQAKKLIPDIVITDIKMPVMDGIEATKQLTEQLPATNVIVYSFMEEKDNIVQVMKAGAKGYLIKDFIDEEIIDAVIAVSKGGTFFSKQATENIINSVANSHRKNQNVQDNLSEKEITIIKLICQEYSNKQIAGEMDISKRSVDGLRDSILKKTNAKNTAGIVVFAIKNHIFQFEPSN